MIGTILFAALYLTFLSALILLGTVGSREQEDERQKWLAHWDEEEPLKEQERVIINNPVTKCSNCDKDEVRLLSCDACGESMCFECAIPCGTLQITGGGFVDADDSILCKKCGVFR